MGPKPKKKTKDDAKSKASEEEILPEVIKQFFEIQISDIKEKTERIRNTSHELQNEKAQLSNKIISFTQEKKNKINELKALVEKTEELKIQKRQELIDITQEIKDKAEAHENHIIELEHQYAAMIEEIIAKREEIESELNSLEDFKQNKDKYLGQFDLEEVLIRELEQEHQRNLYDVNQKYELMKIRLKKELESRLLQLSIEFQATTESKLGTATQRLIRENIAIENEIKIMEGTLNEYEEEYGKAKNNVRQFMYQQKMRDDEKTSLMAKTIVQVDILKTLIMDIAKLTEKLDEIGESELENEKLMKLMGKMEEELKIKKSQAEDLQKYLKFKTEEAETINEKIMILRKNYRRLQVLLRHSIRILEEAKALQLIPIGAIEQERDLTHEEKLKHYQNRRDYIYLKKGKILDYLLHTLTGAKLSEEIQKLLESTESTEHLHFEIFDETDEDKDLFDEPDISSIQSRVPSIYTTGSDISLPRSLSTVRDLSVGRASSKLSELTALTFMPRLSEEKGEDDEEDEDIKVGDEDFEFDKVILETRGSDESVVNNDFGLTFA